MSIEISSIDVVSSKHKILNPSVVVFHFIHVGLPFGTIKVPLSIIIFSRAFLERVLWDFRGVSPKKVVYVFEVGPRENFYICWYALSYMLKKEDCVKLESNGQVEFSIIHWTFLCAFGSFHISKYNKFELFMFIRPWVPSPSPFSSSKGCLFVYAVTGTGENEYVWR